MACGCLIIDLRPPEGDNETDDSLRHAYLHNDTDINVERIKNICVALAGIGVNVCGQQVQAIPLQRFSSDATMTVAMFQAQAVLLVVLLPGTLATSLATSVALSLARHLNLLLGQPSDWLRHCSSSSKATLQLPTTGSTSRGNSGGGCSTPASIPAAADTTATMSSTTSSSPLDQLLCCLFNRLLPLLRASPAAAQLLLQHGPPLLPCPRNLHHELQRVLASFVPLAPPWLPLLQPGGAEQQQQLAPAVALFNRYQVVHSSLCPWVTSAVWQLAWQLGVLDRTPLHPPAAVVQEAFLQLPLTPAAANSTPAATPGPAAAAGAAGAPLLNTAGSQDHWGRFTAGASAAAGLSGAAAAAPGATSSSPDSSWEQVLVPCTLVLLCLGPHVLVAVLDRKQLHAGNATPGAAGLSSSSGTDHQQQQPGGVQAPAAGAARSSTGGAAGSSSILPRPQGAALLQQLLQQFTALVQQCGPGLESASSSSPWVAASAAALQPAALQSTTAPSVQSPTAAAVATASGNLQHSGCRQPQQLLLRGDGQAADATPRPLRPVRVSNTGSYASGRSVAGSPEAAPWAGQGGGAAGAVADGAAGAGRAAPEDHPPGGLTGKKHKGLLSSLLHKRRKRRDSSSDSSSGGGRSSRGGGSPGQGSLGSTPSNSPQKTKGVGWSKPRAARSSSSSFSSSPVAGATPAGLLSRLASMTLQHAAAGVRPEVLAAALPQLLHATGSPGAGGAAAGGSNAVRRCSGSPSRSASCSEGQPYLAGASAAGAAAAAAAGPPLPESWLQQLRKRSSNASTAGSPTAAAAAAATAPRPPLPGGSVLAARPLPHGQHSRSFSMSQLDGVMSQRNSFSSSPTSTGSRVSRSSLYSHSPRVTNQPGGLTTPSSLSSRRTSRSESIRSAPGVASVKPKRGRLRRWLVAAAGGLLSTTPHRTLSSSLQLPPGSRVLNQQQQQEQTDGGWSGQAPGGGGIAAVGVVGVLQVDLAGHTCCCTGPLLDTGVVQVLLHAASQQLPQYQQHLAQLQRTLAATGSSSSTLSCSSTSPLGPRPCQQQQQQQQRGGELHSSGVAADGQQRVVTQAAFSSTGGSGSGSSQQRVVAQAVFSSTTGSFGAAINSPLEGLPWQDQLQDSQQQLQGGAGQHGGRQSVSGSRAPASRHPQQQQQQEKQHCKEQHHHHQHSSQQLQLPGGVTLQQLELQAAAADTAQRLQPADPGPWRQHPELLGLLPGSCHVTLEVQCRQGAFEGSHLLVTLCLPSLMAAMSSSGSGGSSTCCSMHHGCCWGCTAAVTEPRSSLEGGRAHGADKEPTQQGLADSAGPRRGTSVGTDGTRAGDDGPANGCRRLEADAGKVLLVCHGALWPPVSGAPCGHGSSCRELER